MREKQPVNLPAWKVKHSNYIKTAEKLAPTDPLALDWEQIFSISPRRHCHSMAILETLGFENDHAGASYANEGDFLGAQANYFCWCHGRLMKGYKDVEEFEEGSQAIREAN